MESGLRAASTDIGSARAAFFPSVTLSVVAESQNAYTIAKARFGA